MPTIDVSDAVFDFLNAQAQRGHSGDINDYLHSHFRLTTTPKKNEDRTILDFISSPTYTLHFRYARRYAAILSRLAEIDPVRFAQLEGLMLPGTNRILVSSDGLKIQRQLPSAKLLKVEGSESFALKPTSDRDAQDFLVQIMKQLGYPVGVWQKAKRTLLDPIDTSHLGF